MTDILSEIQGRIASLDERVNRLRDELETAEKERSDLQIAQRVYAELTGKQPQPMKTVELGGDAAVSTVPQRPSSEKKRLIRQLLGAGEATAKSPSTVFKQLVAQNIKDIPITQVRTILWRMENKKQGVASKDGRYWLVTDEAEQRELEMPG